MVDMDIARSFGFEEGQLGQALGIVSFIFVIFGKEVLLLVRSIT